MTDEAQPRKTCPKGHPVKSRFGHHVCGLRRCGEESLASVGPAVIDLDAQAKMAPADLEFQGRANLVRLPSNLKGDDATKWAQDKLVELLPEAVASVAHDLRYGSPKTRSEAADKVLRANGMDRREASTGGGGLIVLNIGTGGTDKIPWLQRLQKKE